MTKFVLNVRHRPTMEETIEGRFAHFLAVVRELPPPWALRDGKELMLPPVGTGLSTLAKLRGKLGLGITGDVEFQYRALLNLDDRAAADDAVVIEFDTSKVSWRDLVDIGLPGYVKAIGAYSAMVERWDEMPKSFNETVRVCNATGKDLDGRDGFFRFGPVSYMDRELCRRGCNGLTPEEIEEKLSGVVPEVRLLEGGVLIVAAEDFPEQAEILAADRRIRERLGLPIWS